MCPQPQLSGGAHSQSGGAASDRLHELPVPAVRGTSGDHTGWNHHRRRQAVKREELTEEQQEWLMAYETLNYCGIVDLDDEVRPMFCLD